MVLVLRETKDHGSSSRLDRTLFGPPPSVPGKCPATIFPQLPPPPVHRVRIHMTGERDFGHRGPRLKPPHRGFLEFLGELPSSQSHASIKLESGHGTRF